MELSFHEAGHSKYFGSRLFTSNVIHLCTFAGKVRCLIPGLLLISRHLRNLVKGLLSSDGSSVFTGARRLLYDVC
jgi:hypothetical protein